MRYPSIRLGAFWRRWWLLLVLAAAGGALAAYVYGSHATPMYEAEAQVLVEAADGAAGQSAALLPTYAEMVASTPILAYALRSTNSPASMEALRQRVRGESDRDTRLIAIRAGDSDPDQAVALANALAAGLKRYVAVTSAAPSSATALTPKPQIRLVVPADSAARIRPRSPFLLEFGALAGLFGALAFALVTEARRPKVTSEDDLAELGGLPVLGSVNGAWPRIGTSFLDPTRSSLEESTSYRRLAAQIAVANNEEAPRSLVLVGAEGAEASCAVGAKLALALAQDGRRVVLLDFEANHVRRFLEDLKPKGRAQGVTRVTPLKHGDITFDRFTLRSGAPLLLPCRASCRVA